MYQRLIVFLLLLLPAVLSAQTSYSFKIATDRMLFHDQVDKQQRQFFNKDGVFNLSDDESINFGLEDVLVRQVDELQEKIELDTTITGQVKVKSLKSIETLLRAFGQNRNKRILPLPWRRSCWMHLKPACIWTGMARALNP